MSLSHLLTENRVAYACGVDLYGVKNTEAVLLAGNHLHISFPDDSQNISVPVAAHTFGMLLGSLVLPSSQSLIAASAMLEKKYPAVGFAHPGHLPKSLYGLGQRAQAQGVYDGVKGVVWKFKAFGIHLLYGDVELKFVSFL